MKIILLGTSFPFRGGLASFNERLIREYNREGNDAQIFTFKLQYPNFLFPGKTQYSSSPQPTDLIIKEVVNSINPLNWIKIGRKIKNENPDLIIVKYWLPFMGPCFGTILRLAKRNKKTKVICIVDNIIPHEKRIGDVLFTKYFVKPVNGFIAMSSSVHKDLELFVKDMDMVKFSPHPIFDNFGSKTDRSVACDELKLDPQFRYVLFFGLIRDYKGLDLLIKSVNKSYFDQNKLRILVAGEFYNNEQDYRNLITELNLEKYIVLINKFIPDELVSHVFSVSDLLVQPYKNATQSGVTQIGYHFEIPMVVTNVGGLPELIPDNKVGFVVDKTPEAISKAIETFFDDNLMEKFKENLKVEKEKYSWAKMVESINYLYKKNDN